MQSLFFCLTNPSYCFALLETLLFFWGRYDSYQSAYRQIKDSLECKLQAKMESGELSPKRRSRGGRANRRGRWTQWQRSRWRSSWDKGNGDGNAGGSTGGSAGSSLGPSGTSKEAQQLKQLTDLMELVAGGAWNDDVSTPFVEWFPMESMNLWETWQVKKQIDGAMIGHRLTWYLLTFSYIFSVWSVNIPAGGIYQAQVYRFAGFLAPTAWSICVRLQDVEVGDIRFNAETVWLAGTAPDFKINNRNDTGFQDPFISFFQDLILQVTPAVKLQMYLQRFISEPFTAFQDRIGWRQWLRSLFFDDGCSIDRLSYDRQCIFGFSQTSHPCMMQKNTCNTSDAIDDLGGGFRYFLFPTLFGEDSHFDEHIFQRGWFNHQLVMFVTLFFCCGSPYSSPPGNCDRVLLNKIRFLSEKKNSRLRWQKCKYQILQMVDFWKGLPKNLFFFVTVTSQQTAKYRLRGQREAGLDWCYRNDGWLRLERSELVGWGFKTKNGTKKWRVWNYVLQHHIFLMVFYMLNMSICMYKYVYVIWILYLE